MAPRGLLHFLVVVSLVTTGMTFPSFPQGTAPLPPGTIVTWAGPGLPVEGGKATEQAIDGPSALALDNDGGFYVASAKLHRVYRVRRDGTLGLVAGDGKPGFGHRAPAESRQKREDGGHFQPIGW